MLQQESNAPSSTGDATESLSAAMTQATDFAQKAQDWLVEEGPGIAMGLLTLLIGWWIASICRRITRKVLQKRNVDGTLTGFLSSIVYIALMVMVVISAVGKMGVQTTSFVAVIGAAGLAVGFALQGSLANFASGVLIIFFRPFKAGDFVEVAGTSGTVLEVQIFATTLKTGDNKKVIVPNGSITDGNIVNYSANPTRRIDLVVGIGYGSDMRKAKELYERLMKEDDRILEEPAPVVAVSELADSSVNLVVRPWVKTEDYWAVRFDLTESIKRESDAAGIEIPFPQRDVHLHQVAS